MKKHLKLIVIIALLVLVAIIIFFIISRSDVNNLCEQDGRKFAEFEYNVDSSCQCQGSGNGHSKALWVCRTAEPYFISDQLNISKTYTDEYILINYPKDYFADLSAYAGNGYPHVVFCTTENYNKKGDKRCNVGEPFESYYPEARFEINFIYEYDIISSISKKENSIYLGSLKNGELYLAYYPNTPEMKVKAVEMQKTFILK